MDKPQIKLLVTLILASVCAWVFLFFQHWQMTSQSMLELEFTPTKLATWTTIDFSLALLMWTVMMAAMMLPSAIPMALTFAHLCQKQNDAPYYRTTFFVLAYLCVWFLFSILLTILQWKMHQLAWLAAMQENQQPLSASAILIVAGVYQF